MGELSLRRRLDPALGTEVYEVKLGDEYLMSSLFTAAEIELATLGLAELDGRYDRPGRGRRRPGPRLHRPDGPGGPAGPLAGRGRRARRGDRLAPAGPAAVRRAGRRGPALPAGARRLLRADGRTPATTGAPRPAGSTRCSLDIDHSPGHLLTPGTPPSTPRRACGARRSPAPGWGVRAVVERPAGRRLHRAAGRVFATARAEVVSFDNPLQRRTSTNTVYLARTEIA